MDSIKDEFQDRKSLKRKHMKRIITLIIIGMIALFAAP